MEIFIKFPEMRLVEIAISLNPVKLEEEVNHTWALMRIQLLG
jgi:hypothetical protein